MLERVPGWTWEPRSDHFEARAEELRQFIRAEGRVPRRRTEVTHERVLALWLYRQNCAIATGGVGPEREALLAYALHTSVASPTSLRHRELVSVETAGDVSRLFTSDV